MSKTKKIVLSAMLLALLIVLSRFLSIKTPILVISLSFVPIMMSAIWLGPKYSLAIAALGDLIGAILFPFGAYFPGYTLSQLLTGLIYGLFLYKKPGQEISDGKFIIKLIVSSVLVLGLIGVLLTSLWVHITAGKSYVAVMAGRITTQVIMLPIQVVTIFILEKLTRPITKKFFVEE